MVEVFLVDDNGRRVLNGYGSSYLPCSAGYEELLIHTWRPADKSVKGKLRNWLLGTGPELNEPEAIISSSTQQRWVHCYQEYYKNPYLGKNFRQSRWERSNSSFTR